MTLPDAKTLLRPANTPWLPSSKGAPALPHRMLAICDISADPGGSIEFMNECTTIDTPFCLYDADRNKDTKSFKGPGVLVSGYFAPEQSLCSSSQFDDNKYVLVREGLLHR